MKDLVFVRALLAAVDYPLDKFYSSVYPDSPERRNALNSSVTQPDAWESLMRALAMTQLNLGSLADPPHLVEVRVTNRWSRWTITAESLAWGVSVAAMTMRTKRPGPAD